jgi:hypothetical protein
MWRLKTFAPEQDDVPEAHARPEPATASDADASPPKRGRGRPRKYNGSEQQRRREAMRALRTKNFRMAVQQPDAGAKLDLTLRLNADLVLEMRSLADQQSLAISQWLEPVLMAFVAQQRGGRD